MTKPPFTSFRRKYYKHFILDVYKMRTPLTFEVHVSDWENAPVAELKYWPCLSYNEAIKKTQEYIETCVLLPA